MQNGCSSSCSQVPALLLGRHIKGHAACTCYWCLGVGRLLLCLGSSHSVVQAQHVPTAFQYDMQPMPAVQVGSLMHVMHGLCELVSQQRYIQQYNHN